MDGKPKNLEGFHNDQEVVDILVESLGMLQQFVADQIRFSFEHFLNILYCLLFLCILDLFSHNINE